MATGRTSSNEMHQLAELRGSNIDPERGYAALAMGSPDLSHTPSHSTPDPKASTSERLDQAAEAAHFDGYETVIKFYEHFRAKNRQAPGWLESIKNAVLSSWLNLLVLFIPAAWACHFENDDGHWPHQVTFALCFVSIIPLENIFDWGGEQMALYLGLELGDLVIITLNNAVEAALAIILLIKCELRLLQSTIIGVIILHLLLIPGTAFLAGGAQIWEQNLHPHPTQLNHSLLTVGVMTILLPTAFFAALDRGAQAVSSTGKLEYSGNLLTDDTRQQLLRMSRGLAVILLIIYIGSRIFLHNPPGDDNALKLAKDAPEEMRKREHEIRQEKPKMNPWACMLMLAVTVAIMATTAEFLVDSIEDVRESGGIQEEWFGLILLPIVSFSADGCIAIVFFAKRVLDHITGGQTMTPSQLAKARAIDLSIQFTLFWMPFLVLLGWWIDKPMHLMFDYFELALLLGSAFLVNYVTADSKTNWVEGLILSCFYIMIAICAWFYHGQPELEIMLNCPGTVAAALLGESGEGAGAGAGEGSGTGEVAARVVRAFLN